MAARLLREEFLDLALADVDLDELVDHAEEVHHRVAPDVVDALGHLDACGSKTAKAP